MRCLAEAAAVEAEVVVAAEVVAAEEEVAAAEGLAPVAVEAAVAEAEVLLRLLGVEWRSLGRARSP